jgi:predicted DNA-binding transcriptional regulator AlpA
VTKPPANAAPQIVFSIATFCQAHKISRSFFYELLHRGCGPRLMKIGRRTLISSEAAAEWRARMEAGARAE